MVFIITMAELTISNRLVAFLLVCGIIHLNFSRDKLVAIFTSTQQNIAPLLLVVVVVNDLIID